MANSLFPDVEAQVIDMNLFVTFERHDTVDLPAFRGIERAMAEHGYDDRVQLIRAFDFVDAVEARYQFRR